MAKISTIFVLHDNSESTFPQIIELESFTQEVDSELNDIFGCLEFEVSPTLVKKTLAKIDSSGELDLWN